MATIGQPLTAQESGWKRYDDTHPAIKYDEGFNSYVHKDEYNGGYRWYQLAGKSINFNFYGTKIRLIAQMNNNRGESTEIIIDGNSGFFTEKLLDTQVSQALVYEKTGLESKLHSVQVKTLDSGIVVLDAIDIDSTGRLLHPDEVIDPKDLSIGKRIRCHYQAPASQVGTFSGLGEETSDFIPPASSATPNGDFYFIMVDEENDKKKLIADRNIQHSISWDTLNSAGIASGSGLQ